MTVGAKDIPGQVDAVGRDEDVSAALPGVAEMLELLRLMCRRPRRGELPGRAVDELPRGRRGLPLVCVVRPAGLPVLRALAGHLAGAKPGQIPHAVVSCDLGTRPVGADAEWTATANVADILSQAARSLGGTRNSRYGRIRFRRFALVHWLLSQDLTGGDLDPDRVLSRRLRQRAIAQHRLGGAGEELLAVTSGVTPAWTRTLMWIIPPLWFLVRASGRVPVISQPYRWLLRQPYLAPRDPGTFVGFAERLTVRARAQEDPEQLRKLLVNAFLEDLRAAYRRRPWRPRTARRTTYPVVFLDDATRDNGGYRLLKLINDVRSETGSFDPLLVISGSQRVPPSAASVVPVVPVAGPSPEHVWPADHAREGYQAWCRQFAADSRSRKPTAWYLPIEIAPAPVAGGRHARRDGRRPVVPPRFVVSAAPLWARRGALLVATVAVAVAVAGGGVLVYQQQRRQVTQWTDAHCGQPREAPYAAYLHTDTSTGRCYGISDGSYPFSGDAGIHRALEKIGAQNRSLAPDRPVYVVVHLSALDSTSPTNASMELAGAAARQREYNSNPSSQAQLMIMVANGGAGMEHGREVARQIGALARTDPRVVGALGLSQSRAPTQETIQELGRAGLPVIASTLSADVLVQQSPMYVQVSPQNRREADIAVQYVTRVLGPGRDLAHEVALIQSNDAEDIYSSNLAQDLTAAFSRAGIGYAIRPPLYYPADPAPAHPVSQTVQAAGDLGRDMCGYPGVVFFTGRPVDFNAFLGGVKEKCGSRPPAILGGDDISRYVAEPSDRTRYGVEFQYLSFAVGKTSCGDAGLYANLRDILPALCQPGQLDPSLDGHAALAYDAASVMTHAIESVLRRHLPATPGTVWHQLTTITGMDTMDGETGTIDFNGTPEGQYMSDKAVAVMTVNRDGTTTQTGICGRTRMPSAPWCDQPAVVAPVPAR